MPVDATRDESELARLRVENVRLARSAVELEVRLADARRERRKPIDQPVVRSWVARRSAGDGPPTFDLCVEYFAHGEGANLLPTSLGRLCRQIVVLEAATATAALAAFLASEDFDCWSQAATNQPLPACWRK